MRVSKAEGKLLKPLPWGGILPGEQPPLDAGSRLPQVLGVVTAHVNASYITTHNVADYPILQIL